MNDDALTSTRLDVAEMKGMLVQALSDHGSRISNLEADNVKIHSRLGDKAKTLARMDERVNDLEEDSAGRQGKVFGTLGAVAGLGALVFAVINRFTL